MFWLVFITNVNKTFSTNVKRKILLAYLERYFRGGPMFCDILIDGK